DTCRAVDEVTAAAGSSCQRTVVAAGDPAVEEVEGMRERSRVTAPRPCHGRVARAAVQAGRARDAAVHAAAVVTHEIPRAERAANRVDACVEAIAADRHLPLSR